MILCETIVYQYSILAILSNNMSRIQACNGIIITQYEGACIIINGMSIMSIFSASAANQS